jgi:hypothetical protein
VKPFDKGLLTVTTVFNELIAGVAFISAFVIGIYDKMTGNFMEQKMFAGWVIIFSMLVLFFSLILLISFQLWCKISSTLKNNKKVIFKRMQLFLSLVNSLKCWTKKQQSNTVVPI